MPLRINSTRAQLSAIAVLMTVAVSILNIRNESKHLWQTLPDTFTTLASAPTRSRSTAGDSFVWLEDVKNDSIHPTTREQPSKPSKQIKSDDDDYFLWLKGQRNASLHLTTREQPLQVYYRAMAGLGHQLLRLSSAYHLAYTYKIPRIWLTANPVCGGGGTIFTIYNHLIGEGQLLVDVPSKFAPNPRLYDRSLFPLPPSWPKLKIANETKMSNETRDSLKREMNINNEVPCYVHGIGLWKEYRLQLILRDNLYGKDLSDYQLYHQLMLLFQNQHYERIQAVLNRTKFEEHTVFGLHVRTGNGEKGDFKEKSRGFQNVNEWIKSVMELFCDYSKKYSTYFQNKPLMIYVGTDTGSVVRKFLYASMASCKIPIVSADQDYPEEGESVSFLQKYNDEDKCLRGWEDMFLDMYMFTRCNTVVAGAYSSFTQAAPLSFVMNKAKTNKERYNDHPHYFCEISMKGSCLDCFDTMVDWLKREPGLVWGDRNDTKQKVRHELPFPQPCDHGSTFAGTAMMKE